VQFSLSQDFPARLDRLWTVFGQPDYVRQKYAALGAGSLRLLSFEHSATHIELTLERTLPLQPARLPAWARGLLGSSQTLRQHSRWQRLGPAQVEARLELEPLGLPVRARGQGRIVEGASGACQMRLAWQVHSSLPLLGGRVERLLAEQLKTALAQDHAFTLGYLRAHPG
jgi:hypothetical protein